jgi:hypothetical protein
MAAAWRIGQVHDAGGRPTGSFSWMTGRSARRVRQAGSPVRCPATQAAT